MRFGSLESEWVVSDTTEEVIPETPSQNNIYQLSQNHRNTIGHQIKIINFQRKWEFIVDK